MIVKLERIWKEVAVILLPSYSGLCMEGLKIISKNCSK
jgi:hypothetical protein